MTSFDEMINQVWAYSETTLSSKKFASKAHKMVDACSDEIKLCKDAHFVKTYRRLDTSPEEAFVVDIEATKYSFFVSFYLITPDGVRMYFSRRGDVEH